MMTTKSDLTERRTFIGMDEGMAEDLRACQPIVDEVLPGILDQFYDHVSKYPDVSRMFNNPEHMRHAREMQIKHWARITTGNFDADYHSSVNRIGEAHYRLGLKPRWYIGGYALFIAGFVAAVESHVHGARFHKDVSSARRSKMIVALTTAAFLDMDLAISVYLEQGEKAKTETVDWLSKSFSEIIEIISAAATELEATATSLTGTAELTQRLTAEVSSSSDEASASVQSVASATEELGASVNEIRRQVESSSQIASKAVTEAETTDARISQLSEAANRIGDVVKLITAIADQTKLLALNATIEAERAGDAGMGFAVVAQEVKALAAQTASATKEIGNQIASIQSATADSVSAIKGISKIINDMANISTSIATAVEQQGAATGEIATSAQQAAIGTQNVASNIGEVNRGAMDTGAASGQVLTAAQSLSAQSARLKSEAETFIGKLRAS